MLTVGATIPDTFLYMYALESACQIQLAAQSGGAELTLVNPAIVSGIKAQIEKVLQGMGGDLAWPALLRKLDRRDSSYRD